MAYYDTVSGHYIRKSDKQRRKERRDKMIAKAIINVGSGIYYIAAGLLGGFLVPMTLVYILDTNITPWNIFGIYCLIGMFIWFLIMWAGAYFGKRLFTRVVDYLCIHFGGKE